MVPPREGWNLFLPHDTRCTIAAGHIGPALRPFIVPGAFTARGVGDAAPYEQLIGSRRVGAGVPDGPPCHSEPVTDVTGVGIRNPTP